MDISTETILEILQVAANVLLLIKLALEVLREYKHYRTEQRRK